MARLTKAKLKRILSARLSLKNAQFFLEKADDRLVGDIISPSFLGKQDHERQEMIWDALESALEPELVRQVGMLLAYTPDEWRLGEDDTRPARRKKVG